MLVVRAMGFKRRVGLAGVYACLSVHYPRLAEKVSREEFEVESDFSDEEIWYRPVKVYGHFHAFAYSLYLHCIVEMEIRIDHRVEAGHVAR